MRKIIVLERITLDGIFDATWQLSTKQVETYIQSKRL